MEIIFSNVFLKVLPERSMLSQSLLQKEEPSCRLLDSSASGVSSSSKSIISWVSDTSSLSSVFSPTSASVPACVSDSVPVPASVPGAAFPSVPGVCAVPALPVPFEAVPAFAAVFVPGTTIVCVVVVPGTAVVTVMVSPGILTISVSPGRYTNVNTFSASLEDRVFVRASACGV